MVMDFQHENAIVRRPVLDLCVLEFLRRAEILSLIANFVTFHDSYFLVSISYKIYNMDNVHKYLISFFGGHSMKTKYQTAYCDTMDSFLSVAEVYTLENESLSSYKEKIAGHLWCPECKKVMFSLIHSGNGMSYFRGYPKQEHEEGCSYGLPEIQVKTVAELKQQDPSYERIKLQMQRVLRYTPTNRATHKRQSSSATSLEGQVMSGKTVHKKFNARLPERRIDLPLSDSDLNMTKIFYGTVLVTSTPGKQNPNDRYLTLFSLDKKNRICLIAIPEVVWHYLSNDPLLNGKQVKVCISFCGELTKSNTGALFCKLQHSQLLIVQHP